MENASKALLIAGAILIVILLIAVGMMVFNGARGSIDKAIGQMSATEKQVHNSQFEPYIKNNVPGGTLRTLYSKVISNNSNDDTISVTLNSHDAADDISGEMTNISSTETYDITATYTDGVVSAITTDPVPGP